MSSNYPTVVLSLALRPANLQPREQASGIAFRFSYKTHSRPKTAEYYYNFFLISRYRYRYRQPPCQNTEALPSTAEPSPATCRNTLQMSGQQKLAAHSRISFTYNFIFPLQQTETSSRQPGSMDRQGRLHEHHLRDHRARWRPRIQPRN